MSPRDKPGNCFNVWLLFHSTAPPMAWPTSLLQGHHWLAGGAEGSVHVHCLGKDWLSDNDQTHCLHPQKICWAQQPSTSSHWAQPLHVRSQICQDRHCFRAFQCYDFLFVCLTCGILVPSPGIDPVLPALGAQVLTTEPPGKSPHAMIFIICNYLGSNSWVDGGMIINFFKKNSFVKSMCVFL